jgi:hypothetical protein
MLPQPAFLELVESYLAQHGVKPATFGRLAVKDPNFVFDLRKGRTPSITLAAAVEQYMASGGNIARIPARRRTA